MAKGRVHNEWFRTVSMGGRKSCPCCKQKLGENESIWSWGNYVNAKWRTVDNFCRACFAERVANKLQSHVTSCGCSVSLVGYHCQLPEWLVLSHHNDADCQLTGLTA